MPPKEQLGCHLLWNQRTCITSSHWGMDSFHHKACTECVCDHKRCAVDTVRSDTHNTVWNRTHNPMNNTDIHTGSVRVVSNIHISKVRKSKNFKTHIMNFPKHQKLFKTTEWAWFYNVLNITINLKQIITFWYYKKNTAISTQIKELFL